MKDVKNIERVRKWQEEQKSKGLCIECSNPATGLRCDACNKRRADYRKRKKIEWKENGLCNQCGKETIKNKNQCEKHYLMQVAIDRLGTSKFWKDIKYLIKKQEYKCALTKENISFEDDIINKITFEEYLKTLASKDKTIIDGLLANKNQNNIAHKIGCTQSYVCQRKKRLKKMWINSECK